MFDSGASHNLIPKSVMEKLELDITKPYKDLFSFDSSQVRCLGLIKDPCVSLVQYPAKTILMDVVVANIPPKYGILLSRSSGAKLQGSLQLDMSYATISVFGQPKKLYRETLMKYVVFDNDSHINNFLTLEEDFSSANIDIDTVGMINQKNKIQTNISAESENQMLHPTKFTNKEMQDLKGIDIDEIIKEETEIIDLKDNHLPKGLTPLEYFFDSNDIPRKPKMQPLKADIEDYNIGTEENTKKINLSKTLPPDQKLKYAERFKEFQDVFAWSYEDLKSYDTSVIQHTIPLKEDQKPFKQKLRRINPVLLPLIEKEIKQMYEAGIIAPIRFLEWVSNLVPTTKKIGEIKLCVDLRNLNKVSLKYNYPLPKMDHILQRVVCASRISLLDGFSGFNQILVHPDDQDKTAFTTPWGTFKYVKMPSGLKNGGETFQIAMDIAFAK
eukprot:PITA_20477